jgi:hypothetical protein
MADAIINVTINGVTTAVKDFGELQKVLQKVAAEEKKVAEEAKKAGKEAKEGAKKTEDAVGPAQRKVSELKETFAGYFSDLKKGFMGGVNAIKGFGEAMGLGTKAAKGLAVGLSALGIPLLVAAITALIGYFKNFEGGARILAATMNVLGAIMDQVTQAFIAIVNLDFGKAVDAVKGIGSAATNAVKGTNALFKAQKDLHEMSVELTVTNAKLRREIEGQKKILEDTTQPYADRLKALKEVNSATAQLARNQVALNKAQLTELKAQLALEKNYEKKKELQQQIADAQASLIESQIELNNITYDAGKAERELRKEETDRINEVREKRKAEAAERKQNAQEVADTLEKLRLQTLTNELDVINQTLAAEKTAAQEQLKAKGATAEQLAQLDEYYDQLGIQRVDAYNKKVQEQNDNAAKTEADKKAQDEATALQKQRAFDDQLLGLQAQTFTTASEQLQAEYFASQTALDRQLQDELITREQYQQLVTANDEIYAQKRTAIAKTEAQQRQANLQASLQAVGDIYGQLSELLGKETEAGKQAAIAEAYINTFLSAQKAYTSLSGIPVVGPALGVAAAAAAIATGLSNVQKIKNPPKAETGGMILGPSHSGGGVMIEAEGGEFVINKAAMGVPGVAGMAAMLNSVASPKKYADGGTIENQANQLNALGAMPLRTYVVASEVTSAQQATFQIERLSTL